MKVRPVGVKLLFLAISNAFKIKKDKNVLVHLFYYNDLLIANEKPRLFI